MKESCIVHRKNSRLVVLHEDYVEICDGNMIAAMLLSILIYWTDVKLAQRKQDQEQRKATSEDTPLTSLWIWKSQEGFQHDLLDDKPGMRKVHRSTIATALKLLKDKKFIQSRRNPHNNIDRTQQYLIDQDAINDAIQALSDCIISSIRVSENVQSSVGNYANDSTKTDNGLHNFRQTIPENTNRDYNTEITDTEESVSADAQHASAPPPPPPSVSESPVTIGNTSPPQLPIATPAPEAKGEEKKKVTRTRRKVERDELTQKRIDDIYDAMCAFKQKITGDLQAKFRRDSIDDDEMEKMLSITPAPNRKRLVKVCYDMWNEKDQRTGLYFWRKRMKPRNIAKEYESRIMALEASDGLAQDPDGERVTGRGVSGRKVVEVPQDFIEATGGR